MEQNESQKRWTAKRRAALDGVGDELWSIITPHISRRTTLPDDLRENRDYSCCSDRRRHLERETFPRNLVRKREDLQALAVRTGIMDKIVGPDLIGTRGRDGTQDRPIRSASASPAGRHTQPLLSPDPMHPLDVDPWGLEL